MKVYAPNGAYSGTRVGVVFDDGVGEVDPKAQPGALAYFRRQGYGIGKRPKGLEPTERVDAREAARVMVGTPLRDAAVDPQPGDFLPPINAGEADPHGPTVVSPEIHHPGPKGIRGGEVHVDDADRQEAEETALAEAVLVEGQPHPAAAEAEAEGPPAEKAVKAVWVDHAVARGMSREEAEGLTKRQLVERFGAEG